jgi:branched-chain amino acid transport system substrate-binding protein
MKPIKPMIKPMRAALLAAFIATAGGSALAAPDLKVALIAGKTGALEAYAKETETGFMMGLEYLTGGKMEINGRKIKVIVKDDQGKPDLGRTLLAEAYGDDKVDIAVGTTSSGSALAMLPVAKEYKKVLIVEPAVADEITGAKWNKYIFRTARNSMQDALAAASTLKNGSVAFLAQDYAFGRDAIKAGKEALAATGSRAQVVHEEYAPAASTDFTAPTQRIFDALKDKPQPRVLAIVWAGPNPLNKIADMKPERYGITLAPGGNILPVMKTWKAYAGTEGRPAGGRDGRHVLRDAEGHHELPQGGPPGPAADVPLPHQEGAEERVGPARTGAGNPGRRAAAAGAEQALTWVSHSSPPSRPAT